MSPGALSLSFLGAAQTVTGSKYLLQTSDRQLLVDAGLFQGIKTLRQRNWSDAGIAAQALDAVVLTHAHIDHSGYLPRLVKAGFKGRAYCTEGTADLLKILLPDAGYLQEEEARHANQHGYASHHPALPLYTREDAERCLAQLEPVDYRTSFSPASGVAASFSRAGHILGSACLSLTVEGTRITFSGDVGRPNDPIMRPPDPPPSCDYLVVESTYGDRRHADEGVIVRLAEIASSTINKGGTLVIPAFAVGRAQHLLHLFAELRERHAIPDVPIYLDSPMAIDATEIFQRHPEDHTLSAAQVLRLRNVARASHMPEESRAIDASSEPKIVISASGMATGGRVLHHLRRFLPDPNCSVLLVGYQAAGTRGRSLIDGADELKIHGQYVTVRARIAQIQGLSAHADYSEMLDWLARGELTPKRVFVTHGEPSAADAFRRRLTERFGFQVEVPEQGSRFALH
jgi:metallo-beta-lactamase family protein